MAWSPQPRQGGLRLEAGLRSSRKAQGHRGKPGPHAHSPGGPAGQGRALRPHRAGAGLTRAGEPWRTARPRGSREPLGQNKQTQRAGLRGAEGTGQHTQGSRARGRLRSAQAVRPALASGGPGPGPAGVPRQDGLAGVGGLAEGVGGSWCSPATLAQTGDTAVPGQRAGDPLARHPHS